MHLNEICASAIGLKVNHVHTHRRSQSNVYMYIIQ